MVLAGGKGTRLYPLTKDRAKPAVPFGGKYRIVDFVLSNLVNSGVYSTYVLTQFKSQSLLQHLRDTWQFGSLLPYQFIVPVPAQMRSPDAAWYQGTADAIFQNIDLIHRADTDLVLVFSADHVYRMNIREMIEFHNEKGADATVAAVPMAKEMASEFGVIELDREARIGGFHEKKKDAPAIPGDPDRILASMGNYVFTADVLLRELYADAADEESSHDFGKDILPSLVRRARVCAYDFSRNRIPGDPPEVVPYWRDVGTIDAFYEANMDLRSITPALNLYNAQWPLGPTREMYPPAKFVFDQEEPAGTPSIPSSRAAVSCPAASCATRFSGEPCACTPGPWWKTPSYSTTATSGGTPGCAGPSSTRTCACRKGRPSDTTPDRTGACTMFPKAASSSWRGPARRWR